MAAGDITTSGLTRAVKVLENQTTANSPPSAASDGVPANGLFYGQAPAYGNLVITGTNTGGQAGSFTGRLWLYYAAAALWVPAGTGTGVDKGKINAAASIDETGTDTLRHSEPIQFACLADRFYLELTAAANLTDLDAWIVVTA